MIEIHDPMVFFSFSFFVFVFVDLPSFNQRLLVIYGRKIGFKFLDQEFLTLLPDIQPLDRLDPLLPTHHPLRAHPPLGENPLRPTHQPPSLLQRRPPTTHPPAQLQSNIHHLLSRPLRQSQLLSRPTRTRRPGPHERQRLAQND